MSTTTLVTAEQLLYMPDDGFRYELIAGELKKMSPAGWKHGLIAGRLHGWLGRYVEEHKLGAVLEGDTGFLLASDPDTVRAPDIAFIRRDRLSASKPTEAFWPGPPDLAVEVISPGDTVHEVDDKVKCWLDVGTRMFWVIDPKWRSVTVYRSVARVTVLTENDELSGEDVVDGFRCIVGELFAA
jgi:Uma2 family endonuclease